MAIDSTPRNSPMPVIRNRITVPVQPVVQLPARSPIPTPRNIQNRVEQAPQIRVSESPDVRRRTEPTSNDRNMAQLQSGRLRVEHSPTAHLIHKLFRNRDPKLLPTSAELRPLTPNNSRVSNQLPELNTREEATYSEIPTAPAPSSSDQDEDDSSIYLSIDELNINLDNLRTDSSTPPPAYRSIFDEDMR